MTSKVEITNALMERLREAEAACPCRILLCDACRESVAVRSAFYGTGEGMTVTLYVSATDREGRSVVRGEVA